MKCDKLVVVVIDDAESDRLLIQSALRERSDAAIHFDQVATWNHGPSRKLEGR